MNEKPKDYYRVFAPGVPNVRVKSERLTEADARSRKREILMAYPAATRADRENGRIKPPKYARRTAKRDSPLTF